LLFTSSLTVTVSKFIVQEYVPKCAGTPVKIGGAHRLSDRCCVNQNSLNPLHSETLIPQVLLLASFLRPCNNKAEGAWIDVYVKLVCWIVGTGAQLFSKTITTTNITKRNFATMSFPKINYGSKTCVKS
jgi:hypothetical protein